VVATVLIVGCENGKDETQADGSTNVPSETSSTQNETSDGSRLARFDEQVESTTGEWSFVAPRKANGIVVRYLTHSQSLTNYRRNLVTITVSVEGGPRETQSDAFDSQTTVGSPIPGFWRMASFSSAAMAEGGAVRVSLSVSAGDYRCYVSAVEVHAAE
jgi:hypothetical protein